MRDLIALALFLLCCALLAVKIPMMPKGVEHHKIANAKEISAGS